MRLIGLSLIAINNKSERVSVLSVSLELTNLTCLLVYQPMDFGMREYRGQNKAVIQLLILSWGAIKPKGLRGFVNKSWLDLLLVEAEGKTTRTEES